MLCKSVPSRKASRSITSSRSCIRVRRAVTSAGVVGSAASRVAVGGELRLDLPEREPLLVGEQRVQGVDLRRVQGGLGRGERVGDRLGAGGALLERGEGLGAALVQRLEDALGDGPALGDALLAALERADHAERLRHVLLGAGPLQGQRREQRVDVERALVPGEQVVEVGDRVLLHREHPVDLVTHRGVGGDDAVVRLGGLAVALQLEQEVALEDLRLGRQRRVGGDEEQDVGRVASAVPVLGPHLRPGHLVERLGELRGLLADGLVLVHRLGDLAGLDQEPGQGEVGELDDAQLPLVGGLGGGDLAEAGHRPGVVLGLHPEHPEVVEAGEPVAVALGGEREEGLARPGAGAPRATGPSGGRATSRRRR